MCTGGSKSNSAAIQAQQISQMISAIQFSQQMEYMKEQSAKNDARVAELDAKYAEEKRISDLTPKLDEDFMSGATSLADKNDRLLGTKRFVIPVKSKTPLSGDAGLAIPVE